MKKIIFLLSLLLATNLFAQDSELLKVRINLFEGGQNSYDLDEIISPNQGALIQNAFLSRKGLLQKRTGQALFATDESNTAWTGIGRFDPDLTTSYMTVASGGLVNRSTNSASWVTVNSATPLTAGKTTEFIQANSYLIILNGQDNTSAWDGTKWYQGVGWASGSPPVATTAAWLRNYLFAAGNSTNPDWVYFSNNLAPLQFTAADILKINTGDGQAVIRLEPFKLNELIAYKSRSIYIIDITGSTPLTNWTVQPITKAVGCAAARSVVNIGNDHWFLSSEPFAVRSLSRTSFDKLLVDIVSQPIQDIFNGQGTVTINETVINKACAVLFDSKYILAIPTGTSTVNNLVCVYDFLSKSWFTIDGWFPAGWVVFDNNLYYIDALDGRVVQCFTGTTGDMSSGPVVTHATASEPSVGISFDYQSKNIDFDNVENYKQLDSLEVEFDPTGSYNAIVYINLDNGGWQNVGTVNLAGGAPTLPIALPFNLGSSGMAKKTFQLQRYGEFRKIKVRIVQNVASQSVKLKRFCLFARMKQWRRE